MKPANARILTINGGSSSITFALFEAGDSLRRILEGRTERIGQPRQSPCFAIRSRNGSACSGQHLGGLDTLVLAGRNGENAPLVRRRICDGLGFLGIEFEEKQNAENGGVISSAVGRAAVRVIHTDEELMLAHLVLRSSPVAKG